jgi:glutamine synthetase type III
MLSSVIFYQGHKRIVFNGKGYSKEWKEEALQRGLPDFKDTVSALPQMASEKSIELFEKQKIFTKSEITSRLESICRLTASKSMWKHQSWLKCAESMSYPLLSAM